MWPRLKYVSILLSIFEYNDFNKNVHSNDEVLSKNTILPNSLKSVAEVYHHQAILSIPSVEGSIRYISVEGNSVINLPGFEIQEKRERLLPKEVLYLRYWSYLCL